MSATLRQFEWWQIVDGSGWPMTGLPGATVYFNPRELGCIETDAPTLLHYDEHGALDGVLVYFPNGSPKDPVGGVTLTVRPDRRRSGLASRLLDEACRRWPTIDLSTQATTPAGARFLAAYLASRVTS